MGVNLLWSAVTSWLLGAAFGNGNLFTIVAAVLAVIGVAILWAGK